MSRTKRFLDGVWLGYAYQGLMMVVGLWLTPFLLHHIGRRDFGVWVVGTQLLVYLAFLDIGVMTLLPREAAYITGKASGPERDAELSQLFGRLWRVVLYQLPVVIMAATLAWIFMPGGWREFRGPIAVTLVAFVAAFPFQIFQVFLQGLQDFRFLGILQICTWIISTAVTIGLVFAGYGLYGLAIGWALTQLMIPASAGCRLWRRFSTILPRRLPHLSWRGALSYLSRGSWMSLTQVSVSLLNADVLIVGKFLGPAALVPYACTSKLVSVLYNQPTMLMAAAQPGLSELKTGAPRERIFHAVTALTQALLLLSGLVGCVVLAVNRSFVGWWVGSGEFAGMGLTAVFVLNMLLRHWNTTAVYSVFCFGYERRICLTTLLDGCITVGAAWMLVPRLGPIGAPLGSILSVSLTSLPGNLAVLKREMGVGAGKLVVPLWPWFWKFALLSAAAVFGGHLWSRPSVFAVAAIAGSAALIYVGAMFGTAANSVLGSYLQPRLMPLWNQLRGRATVSRVVAR